MAKKILSFFPVVRMNSYIRILKTHLVSDVNIFNPDYEKHPTYRNATPDNRDCGKGETIFIPWGIWHSSESLSPEHIGYFRSDQQKKFHEWTRDVWQYKKTGNKLKAVLISMGYYAVAANVIMQNR